MPLVTHRLYYWQIFIFSGKKKIRSDQKLLKEDFKKKIEGYLITAKVLAFQVTEEDFESAETCRNVILNLCEHDADQQKSLLQSALLQGKALKKMLKLNMLFYTNNTLCFIISSS